MSSDGSRGDHDVTIRPARSDDLDQLRALDIVVFQQLAYPYFVLRQLFDVHRDCWLVAEHPAGVVGYSLGVPTSDRELAWLLALAVHPEHRRRGYGRRLTLGSLAFLRSMGVAQVRLTVEPRNGSAITLYRQIGFATNGCHRDYLGPGEDRLIMARPCAVSGGRAHATAEVPTQTGVRYATQRLP